MSRIKNAFENKKAFIGFITAGDPSLEKTEEFVLQMEQAGAALVELGIPSKDRLVTEEVQRVQKASTSMSMQMQQLQALQAPEEFLGPSEWIPRLS